MAKIKIIQSDNRNNEPYVLLSRAVNSFYAKQHNYDYDFFLITDTEKHPAWYKLKYCLQVIDQPYDYFVYIDSDAGFTNNRTLEDWIPKNHKELIFINDKPWSNVMPCSGFFIFTPKAKKFIKEWQAYNKSHDWKHPYEQYALYQQDLSQITLIDEWQFQTASNQLIRHIGTHEKENRVKELLELCKSLL